MYESISIIIKIIVSPTLFNTSADTIVITNDISTIQVVIHLFFLNIVVICLHKPTRKAEPANVTRIAKEKHIAKVAGLPFKSLGNDNQAIISNSMPIATHMLKPINFSFKLRDGHISPRDFLVPSKYFSGINYNNLLKK